MAVACSPLLSGVGEEAPLDGAMGREAALAELKDVTASLKQWRTSFTAKHGRCPGQNDLENSSSSRQLFEKFRTLRRRLGE